MMRLCCSLGRLIFVKRFTTASRCKASVSKVGSEGDCQDGSRRPVGRSDADAVCSATYSNTPPQFQNISFTSFKNLNTTHDFYRTSSKMPSRANPNVPNKQRRIASRAKVQKRNSVNKISKNPRGTAKSSVLHPTSGPLAPVSGKKAKKLERAQNQARRRAIEKAMEQEGEVEMTGKRFSQVIISFF